MGKDVLEKQRDTVKIEKENKRLGEELSKTKAEIEKSKG